MRDLLRSRVKKLNNPTIENGKSIVYIMSRDQRVDSNPALFFAQKLANEKGFQLVVVFILYPKVKERLKQQFEWMIEGLKLVEKKLHQLNIDFILITGYFSEVIDSVVDKFNPSAIVFDFSPLNGPRKQKQLFAERIDFPCYVVDAHNLIPVWVTSNKQEYGAQYIRKKIYKLYSYYLDESYIISKQESECNVAEVVDWEKVIKSVSAKVVQKYKVYLQSGENKANAVLEDFLLNKLTNYNEFKNNPNENVQSNLSAYLHFGQISSLQILKALIEKFPNKDLFRKAISSDDTLQISILSFVEELVVRKELAENFCYYNTNYSNELGAPNWAKSSLKEHTKDNREYIYSLSNLEIGLTHDPVWNTIEKQLVTDGKIHGYLRMYWAKKILEWSVNPTEALKHAIYLNDKYELDGYDPNGYVGCLWSIYGLHDRPWFDRPVFGLVRYMNTNGLNRRFRLDEYISKVFKNIE